MMKIMWTACVRQATVTPAGVELRGEAEVALQLDRGSGAPIQIRRKIPFSEVLPWEGDPATGGSASAWATVASLELTPSDGERGNEIACDLTLDLLAEATCPIEERALVDLFSVKEPFAVKTGKIGVTDVCFCGGGIFTLEGDAERSACNCEDAMTVLGESAVVSVADASMGEDGATVAGECRVFATVGSPSGEPDGETVYSAVNFRFPYSVTVPIPAECRAAGRIDATAIPISVSLRLDPSRLLASVETAVTVRVRNETETTVVESAEPGEGEAPARAPGEIVAVYPAGGETLWEIAGKYGVSPREIARQNDLPDGAADAPDAQNSLDGVVRLLIG
ncbi:MAG: LysM peptidoglycan-binding domain-containing protein [Clostridia bacterium]|nr:LysM peptidoglycan-binding domain-containing protein [Clostridia bacterium]